MSKQDYLFTLSVHRTLQRILLAVVDSAKNDVGSHFLWEANHANAHGAYDKVNSGDFLDFYRLWLAEFNYDIPLWPDVSNNFIHHR